MKKNLRAGFFISTLVLGLGFVSCSSKTTEIANDFPRSPSLSQVAPAASPVPESGNKTVANKDTQQKIIKTADLQLEQTDPNKTFEQLTALIAQEKGFVLNSNTSQFGEQANDIGVSATVRVPEPRFEAVIAKIRALGRVLVDQRNGQDVTEEFTDLNARLKAKRAVENQYLQILKNAVKISDLLAVQEKLGEVRSQIEQLEGRSRYLENQTSLSTITISIRPPTGLFKSEGPGFWDKLKTATAEGFASAVGLVLGLVRFLIVALAFLLFVVLPAWFLLRFVLKRWPLRRAG